KNILLNVGADYENDQYNLNTDFGITDDSLQKYGIFGLTTIPLPNKMVFIVGARGAEQANQLNEGSDIDTINRALATTVGLTFYPLNNVKAYIRRAGSFRFPKADEESSTPPGTKGLKTQRGDAYEAGAEWSWEGTQSQISIYQLNLRDEIAFDPQQTPDRPFGTNTNYSPTVRQGFTLSQKYNITNQVSVDGEYHFVNAKFQNGIYSGKQIPLVSENIFHGGINYAFMSYWNIYSEAIYTGSQYAANDNANIAGAMGGYTTFNMNLRFVYQKLVASFRVNNIFNKYYYLYTTFEPSIDEQFFYPAPARNILLTLKYEIL
ncbi:MAG: TonB-dependent receptor, partial [Gammaproteobacteria bacterium]|nr:TonB-dependent receptor [Gammaproteobacteria bacterium]